MKKRYEYKFVSVNLKRSFILSGKVSDSYRQDIVENARDGWRFVQAFAPPIGAYGSSSAADLIFEREIPTE